MKILIDADACPVVGITETLAKQYHIPLTLLCDTSHSLNSQYADIITVDKGADSADIRLVNLCAKGDIVITQDYGVAALALGKCAYVLHQSGKEYTNDNIDGLLAQRHIAKKIRRSSPKTHLKGPKKRTAEDDEAFKAALENLINRIKKNH